jgi:nucleoside phosphorylase
MSATTADARREQLLEDPTGAELARHVIMFDPDSPEQHVFAPAAVAARASLSPIPWPDGLAPQMVVPSKPHSPQAALPRADVLVVTWTVAEAKALADVLTPGHPSDAWNAYEHEFESVYKPLIRPGAPASESKRLGLYSRCRIGAHDVLCVKSELHLSQDGPQLPVRRLWKQIIAECQPKLVISTGTAGGIGAQTLLGDVVVTRSVQFDCQKTFERSPFAKSSYADVHALSTGQFEFADRSLLPANADRLPAASRPPKILVQSAHEPRTVLTTDFFAFDDAENSYGLRTYNPRARAVEMGDAVLGLVCSQDIEQAPPWVIVRNASDPQIAGNGDVREQASEAAHIYERYGYWTTVGSAIACWAVIAG